MSARRCRVIAAFQWHMMSWLVSTNADCSVTEPTTALRTSTLSCESCMIETEIARSASAIWGLFGRLPAADRVSRSAMRSTRSAAAMLLSQWPAGPRRCWAGEMVDRHGRVVGRPARLDRQPELVHDRGLGALPVDRLELTSRLVKAFGEGALEQLHVAGAVDLDLPLHLVEPSQLVQEVRLARQVHRGPHRLDHPRLPRDVIVARGTDASSGSM